MVDLILNDFEDDMRKCYDINCTCVTTRGVNVLKDAHVQTLLTFFLKLNIKICSRLLTTFFDDENKQILTSNHLFYGRTYTIAICYTTEYINY